MEPRTSSQNPTLTQSDPNGPVRTCVGCREKAARQDLVRLVLENDHVVVDEAASRPGRGAWLHRSPDCLEAAIKRKAFARAFRTSVADASSLDLPLT